MRSLRVALLACAACAASTGSRTVVTTTSDLVEVDPAAQPASPTPAAGEQLATTPPPAQPAPTPGLPTGSGPMVFGLLDGEMALEDAWERWSAGKTGSYDAVFEIAVLANRARPLPMSDELMVIALARAVEMSACEPERLGRIRLLAIAVHTSPHLPELDGELARLADIGPQECATLQR